MTFVSPVLASASVWGLVTATALASFVEFVEAFTIVLAMGLTRGWRSTLVGSATAVVALRRGRSRRRRRTRRSLARRRMTSDVIPNDP